MKHQDLKEFLDSKVEQFNTPEYIKSDPISIPHRFSKTEDIEISAFLASSIAWGLRKTIIKNANSLIEKMDNSPFDFVMNANERDLKSVTNFKHRTMNGDDALFFITALMNIYRNHGGLQKVFESNYEKTQNIQQTLKNFRDVFFKIPHLKRSEKHISDTSKNSAAKRLCMMLRWLIRSDNNGVDFGIWKNIPASALYIPLDVHAGNVSRKLGLLTRTLNDWKAVDELTQNLRKFDANDPVKYDFALFGLGVFEKF